MNNNLTFVLVCFLTLATWILAGYLAYSAWKAKRAPRPNPILGYVDRVISDENGVRVEGRLTEEGKKLHDESQMTALSIGFRPTQHKTTDDGVRVIENVELMCVSLDAKPGPYGGKIESVERSSD